MKSLTSELATWLEETTEHLEALAEQEGHGDVECDGEGTWHSQFCEEHGCILRRINGAKSVLAKFKTETNQ